MNGLVTDAGSAAEMRSCGREPAHLLGASLKQQPSTQRMGRCAGLDQPESPVCVFRMQPSAL
jgi:hypothetical protein